MTDKYCKQIKSAFSSIIIKTKNLLGESAFDDVELQIETINKTISNLEDLMKDMKEYQHVIGTIIPNLTSKGKELKEDAESFNIVVGKKGKKNWSDITDSPKSKKSSSKLINNILEKSGIITKKQKELSTINEINIGKCYYPIVEKIEDIPASIYWYKGDEKNGEGLYVCLSKKLDNIATTSTEKEIKDCYIQIPFPDLADSTKVSQSINNKIRSIKCKHDTLPNCEQYRKNIAKSYNSEVRKCTYAHVGEKYIRIGTSFRCPFRPSFGAYESLPTDMKHISETDIKVVLMNALHDILLSNIWSQQTKKISSSVITNLDVCS
jgi:hypothetical protein